MPKANREWWQAKLSANACRDAATNEDLANAGWLVLRVWEHEDVTTAGDAIEAAVRARSGRRDPLDV